MRKMTRMGVAGIVATAVLLLLAIDKRQGRGELVAADRNVSKAIAIDGARFRPGTVVVSVNQAVEWVNHDPYPHNVSSEAGRFRSGNLSPNGRFRFRPMKRGTFEYVCTLHPGMKAVLRVQ
jgi:plastocyanin